MHSVLLIFHVLIAIALIGLILVQHGKGADMGAAFGSGASSTVFGARGSGSFLTTATAILAALFFSNSFLLDYIATKSTGTNSLVEQVGTPAANQKAPDSDNTEVVDTEIKPIEKATETPAAPTGDAGGGDLPPIPGAVGSTGASTQKPAPTAGLKSEAVPTTAATSIPEPTAAPTEAPTATPEPTPQPTAAPTPQPTATPAPTATKQKGHKAKPTPVHKKPGKPAPKHHNKD